MTIINNKILDAHSNKYSATGTEAGFDFQFYAFVLLILQLNLNESIQYDTYDDIVYIDDKKIITLIQAKHTIQKNKNLTQSDLNLWKSIENWLELRKKLKDSDFFKKFKFKILINKPIAESNKFYQRVENFRNGISKVDDIDTILYTINNETAKELIGLKEHEKKLFYNNFYIEIIPNRSITEVIRRTLKEEKYISDHDLEDIFSRIISTLHEEKYFNAFKKDKFIIDTQRAAKIMKAITSSVFHNRELDVDKSIPIIFPEESIKTISIQQLIDIDCIDIDSNDSQIYEIHEQRLHAVNSLNYFFNEELIISIEQKEIDDDAICKWNRAFSIAQSSIVRRIKNGTKPISEDEYAQCGVECYREIVKTTIKNCTEYLSLGYFYHLSDIPSIGWRYDWKDKYMKTDE